MGLSTKPNPRPQRALIPTTSLRFEQLPRARSGLLCPVIDRPPLGLYVHIPFCVRKCHYCDFASGPAPEAIREQYVEILVEEIRRSPWRGAPARTVFFGGGTPSELK